MDDRDARPRRAVLAFIATGTAAVAAAGIAGGDTGDTERRTETEASETADDSSETMTVRDAIAVRFDHCKRVHIEGTHRSFSHATVLSWEADVLTQGVVAEEQWTTVTDLPATVALPGGPNEPAPAALRGVRIATRTGEEFTETAPGNCRALVERYIEDRDRDS
ncbi:hypothetical protein [Natrialba sp. INN-245]|uniref:hypothetical protein n=1 Tax=Natrialba sp. INN-245 TaxID=2690967 RepID=UPI001310D81D|nr:hypothetical protein [Natrialba sp. INN-245]MWV41873.1 hypothetical protein [Natrialba sp. INN-245]